MYKFKNVKFEILRWEIKVNKYAAIKHRFVTGSKTPAFSCNHQLLSMLILLMGNQ